MCVRLISLVICSIGGSVVFCSIMLMFVWLVWFCGLFLSSLVLLVFRWCRFSRMEIVVFLLVLLWFSSVRILLCCRENFMFCSVVMVL